MRRVLALCTCVLAGFALASIGGAFAGDSTRERAAASALRGLVDLSHPFNEQTIYWPTARRFTLTKVAEGETEGGWFYAANNFSAAEHGGTHLDAPIHFARGGDKADEIPLRRLAGAAGRCGPWPSSRAAADGGTPSVIIGGMADETPTRSRAEPPNLAEAVG